MEKEERSRSNEWVSHFSPVCLLISRVLEPERKRERERERKGMSRCWNLPSGYAPMAAAFRVVISLCWLCAISASFVGTERRGERKSCGSGLAIVYTSSSFRAERDPRVTFVSGVPDAARRRLHRCRGCSLSSSVFGVLIKAGFVANQPDSFLT